MIDRSATACVDRPGSISARSARRTAASKGQLPVRPKTTTRAAFFGQSGRVRTDVIDPVRLVGLGFRPKSHGAWFVFCREPRVQLGYVAATHARNVCDSCDPTRECPVSSPDARPRGHSSVVWSSICNERRSRVCLDFCVHSAPVLHVTGLQISSLAPPESFGRVIRLSENFLPDCTHPHTQ